MRITLSAGLNQLALGTSTAVTTQDQACGAKRADVALSAREASPSMDYGNLPVHVLRQRICTLTIAQLESVIAYESNHGQRVVVLEMMRQRLNEVHDDARASAAVEPPTRDDL
jgi:hypothetical protein